jgi:ribonuclease HI
MLWEQGDTCEQFQAPANMVTLEELLLNIVVHLPLDTTKQNLTIEEKREQESPRDWYRRTIDSISEPKFFLFSDGSLLSKKAHKWAQTEILGVGCASAQEDQNNDIKMITRDKLHKFNGIFEAEILGLYNSIRTVQENDVNLTRNIIIAADNQSALLEFSDTEKINSNLYALHAILKLANISNTKFHLLWSPGHIGIVGNEHTDKEAKQVVKDETLVPKFILLPATMKFLIKQR